MTGSTVKYRDECAVFILQRYLRYVCVKIRGRRSAVLSEPHLQEGLVLAGVSAPVNESMPLRYDEL